MKRRVILLLLLLSLLPRAGEAQSAKIDALVEAFMTEERVAGVAVAVMQQGKVIHAKGYGLADLEQAAPASERTVFKVASLSKQFTAVSVLMLAEQGKVDLGAGIRTYFPEYPERSPNPTIEQLLNHTSALDFAEAWSAITPPATADSALPRDRATLPALFKGTTFDFAPGTHFRYNNNAYALLGLLIERVSGLSYATFVRQRIFEPLGMAQTYYLDTSPIIANRATGYTFRNDTLVNAPFSNPHSTFAAGALGSTVLDLLVWRRALLENRLISVASSRRMTAAGRLADATEIPYGLGLFLLNLDGRTKIDHYGNTTGFRAELAYYPSSDLTVTVLANTNPSRTEVLESRISRMLMGIPEATVKEVAMTVETLRSYAGTFMVTDAPISHRSVATEIALRGDGLFVGRFRLRAIGMDLFVPEGDPYHHYTFTMRDGRATALRVEREGRVIADARRVD